MIKVTLKSSEWFRGGDDSALTVIQDDGTMQHCCLGIVCRDIFGIPPNEMQEVLFPYDLLKGIIRYPTSEFQKFVEQLDEDTHLKPYLMPYWHVIGNLNDKIDIDDIQRVRQLNTYFAHVGIELIFDPEA